MPLASKDICEPLNVSQVCRGLNDTERLCEPSSWAGDMIQEAINRTQQAMSEWQSHQCFQTRLRGTLATHLYSPAGWPISLMLAVLAHVPLVLIVIALQLLANVLEHFNLLTYKLLLPLFKLNGKWAWFQL
jgi:hypothetical protein